MSGGPFHTWPSTITDETCPVLVSEPPRQGNSHRCGRATKAKTMTVEGACVRVCGVHHRMAVRRGGLNRYDFDGGGGPG